MFRHIPASASALLLVVPILGAQEPPPLAGDPATAGPQPAVAMDTVPAAAPAQLRRTGELHAVPLLRPDGPHAEGMRLDDLRRAGGAHRSLLRSPSTLTPRLGDGVGVHAVLLLPDAATVWNSAIPNSLNEGTLWAGRGFSSRTMVGGMMEAGPLRVIAAPEVVWSENRGFVGVIPQAWADADPHPYVPPFLQGPHSLDLPYRLGDHPLTELTPGQSSVTLRAGPVEVGGATEAHWWGPGVRNAVVLSTNAPGFPHAFLRTAAPLRTPLGAVEGRWILGRLEGSGFAGDSANANAVRSLSALAVTVAPTNDLTLGAARSVYAPAGGSAFAPARFADVLGHWDAGRPNGDTEAGQVFSLFGRFVAPAEGAEVYAEWARHEMPHSLRDLLESPEHSQGFTVGAGWARPVASGAVRLRAELSHLERGSTFRARPIGSFYGSERVPAGYTHRGRVLGAAIGPGSQSQWFAADYVLRGGSVGVFGGRTRWSNDAYYDNPAGHRWLRGHDVSVLGGLTGSVAVGAYLVHGEWTTARRHNLYFQNWSLSWRDRYNSINVTNHTLRFSIVPRLPARR